MLRVALLITALALAACAAPSEAPPAEGLAQASADTLEVAVRMEAYRFRLSQDTFRVGQPYRFAFTNADAVAHEWAVVPRGAPDERDVLVEVEEDRLGPEASHAFVYTFAEAGDYDFACFLEEPVDHHAAGMVQPVTVR